MDSLSIMVSSDASWDEFVESVSNIVGVAGLSETDDFGKRHVWKALNTEFIGIDQPDLDDDQGIPFSKFNCQLDLIASNLESPNETERFYCAVGRFVTIKLKRSLTGDIQLIQNLQTLVSVS